jgi:proteasome lid subunit RPN8/RPN11
VLRFSPTAWAKLLFLRDAGDTEIGAFGIAMSGDLLFMEDVQLVRQTCTWATVEFDDESVANFFDEQVDRGRRPEEFGRVWLHSHPGSSSDPSPTDEATFARVFGRSDWAVMFILARDGQTYARLRYNVGPGADLQLPVEIDYGRPFGGSDKDLWQDEYLANVRVALLTSLKAAKAAPATRDEPLSDDWWRDAWADYLDGDRYEQETEYGYLREF